MTESEQQERFARAEYLRSLEKSFAFERASGVIESECTWEPVDYDDDSDENGWWDIDTAAVDLSQEVEYLESRGLLTRHPNHPNWVLIRDEEEPCAAAQPACSADSAGAAREATDFERDRVIEVHEITERILARAVDRWCHANGLRLYTVDQILRDARLQAAAQWENKMPASLDPVEMNLLLETMAQKLLDSYPREFLTLPKKPLPVQPEGKGEHDDKPAL